MTTRIEMLNRALLRIGADPLDSETDPGAPAHLAVYDSTLEHIAAHPWTFFKTTQRLVRLSARPAQHYAYAFQLPATRIGAPRAVYPSAQSRVPTTDYHIEGDTLLTDLAEVWLEFMELRQPAHWPGQFREAFTVALMAELALTIREDRVLWRELTVRAFGNPGEGGAGGLVGQALTADNMAEPGDAWMVDGNPLIDVR